MTKIKMIILSVALALMIVPCAILIAACGCTPTTPANSILGDWKLESITLAENGQEETISVGDQFEGEEVSDNFITLNFTETKVEIKMLLVEETITLNYTKAGNVYTTEIFIDGKAVFTLLDNGKLKFQAYNYNTETSEYELEESYYTLVKGKATAITPKT